MRPVHFYCGFVCTVLSLLQVSGFEYATLSHDGPVILGGRITFRADLYGENGGRPSGTFRYKWSDNANPPHEYETSSTWNTTSYWTIDYPPERYTAGSYTVNVKISQTFAVFPLIWNVVAKTSTEFYITEFLNGNITIEQSNKTLDNTFVSSAAEAKLSVNFRKGDYDYVMKRATSITTYWFIDCKYYGQTSDFTFLYNFTNPNVAHDIETLVVVSYEPLTTTTVSPPTTTPTPTTTVLVPNVTTSAQNTTGTTVASTTVAPVTNSSSVVTTVVLTTSTLAPVTVRPTVNSTALDGNISLPYICTKPSIVPPDPDKTYGHFMKRIDIRAPVTNISVEGTNWIQPWDMLSLNVTCKGSGPFYKCLKFHRGIYNVTGNETCENGDRLQSCNFSIIHYFLEPSVYTILVILNNDVSTQISRLTINIYKVTTKPQLSVIIVPVSCSLAAVVLIVFGVAYYIQSRARFTIEVADFDFGQNNPEMEYKTFRERLRDSFNNAGYKPLSNPQTLQ